MKEKLRKPELNRLARECAKLDPALEKAMAEEGLGEELDQWQSIKRGDPHRKRWFKP
jgi:hypothetical protein